VYARIASFEGGDTERLNQLNEKMMKSGEMTPPQGMKRVLMLADGDTNRRQFIAFFDTPENLSAAEEGFDKMGDEIPEDVRGRRTSVDVYEVVLDQEV
jgi:hypothetical protein